MFNHEGGQNTLVALQTLPSVPTRHVHISNNKLLNRLRVVEVLLCVLCAVSAFYFVSLCCMYNYSTEAPAMFTGSVEHRLPPACYIDGLIIAY